MDRPNELLGALRQTIRETVSDGGAPRRSQNLENTLEAAARAAQSGDGAAGVAAVKAQRDRLQMARDDMQNHMQGAKMEGTAAALVERIRVLYDMNGEGLDALEAAVAAGDADAVEQASIRLRTITDDMFECYAAWEAEMRLLEQQSGNLVMVPDSYARLYEACEKVATRQIALVEWQKVLDAVDREVRAVQERVDGGLAGLMSQLHHDPYAGGIAAQVQLGLLESVKGLERMRAYKTSGNVTDLNEGWNGLVAGNLKVQKAVHTLTAGHGSAGDVVILEDE